jgi:predicted acylesterase/phospholipase RssA
MSGLPQSRLPRWLAGANPTGRRALAAAAAMSVAGCASPVRLPAVPRGQGGQAIVLGVANERFRVEHGIAGFNAEASAAIARRAVHLGGRMPPFSLLAISGGGENGAFGAGLLCGWSARGDRPEFDLVTGVSTGALTAPFAFVGASKDPALRSVYTEITLADVAVSRYFIAALTDDALADTTPLLRTVSRHLDEAMLAEIARGYREGRLLLVGTTDLDAQLPVIWNIGAIAASGHPGALELVRRVLLASAAIPGAFPPVMFDVWVDGEARQEMHVDGGAINQAFLYPPALTEERRALIARGRPVRAGHVYLIRNARLDPDWALVERRTLGITGRAIATMLAASGFNDVVRIWNQAQRDRMVFNLAYIGRDFEVIYDKPFDPDYMRPLFENGFARASRGFNWSNEPPLVDGRPVQGTAGRG